MMDKISVIIPAYNCEKTIIRCVDSILRQSYDNFEIIIINDGSQDLTAEILNNNYNNNSKIRYYSTENCGVSSARNFGVSKATGKYVLFVDSDDSLDKFALYSLMKNVEKDTLVSLNHITMYNDHKYINKLPVYEYDSDDFIYSVLSNKLMGVVWGKLFNLDYVKSLEFDSNTNYLEDTLFLVEYVNKYTKKIKYVDENIYYNYFIVPCSLTSNSFNVEKKCDAFIYSLDRIDSITNSKFKNLINNKKIILLEKELRLVSDKKVFKNIIKKYKFSYYSGNSFRIKFFWFLYNFNFIHLLFIYYFFRKCLKKLIVNVF